MNNSGMLTVVVLFSFVFAGIGWVCLTHIPARQALKEKITNACIKEGGDAIECKHKTDSMTQKEREALK